MTAHTPAELDHEEHRYLVVFGWLAVLTALEIGVIYMPMSKMAIGFILVILASTKAALVALYYMHLANEKRTLTYIALTPAILCVFLVFMLLPDLGAVTRALTHVVAPAHAEAPAHH
jgi:cytochrome c oxidase subunit 4